MAITIKNVEVEELAREAAKLGGTSLTEAIRQSLEARLLKLKGRVTATDTAEELMTISRRCAALPDQDARSEEEILGYNARGGLLPHGD